MFVKNSRPFKAFLTISGHILWIFLPKLALYIYIGNVISGGNPVARFMVSIHEYTELEARGPLVGKILSIAIMKKQNWKSQFFTMIWGGYLLKGRCPLKKLFSEF